MTYKLIIDKNEITNLLNDYFFEVSGVRGLLPEALKYFGKKEGFGSGGKTILFLNDLDESDEAYAVLKGDGKVLLSVDEATSSADQDCEAYLTFQEFYDYLIKEVQKVSKEKPEQKQELESLMLDVKKGLNI
ncbi:hypothetical protein F3157_10120 [Virgibacillus dakarensis]|uniref:CDI immunity protein domain-containing protein n=1 Tax=Lentibacillus populi TaxID=1827502 RepID=A0A9W5X712_9BACI|nr:MULTISPECIES: hypothetical protein [Bacillaceae]MBT2215555.1 hypothetical protein [Virgibacillus dakarensis]MTW86010.1 hypothetical protein [Virgibacillus dakarensis]GGB56525.1 hypothetical protein GCM10011409_37630 [Lentibacillus populi]